VSGLAFLLLLSVFEFYFLVLGIVSATAWAQFSQRHDYEWGYFAVKLAGNCGACALVTVIVLVLLPLGSIFIVRTSAALPLVTDILRICNASLSVFE